MLRPRPLVMLAFALLASCSQGVAALPDAGAMDSARVDTAAPDAANPLPDAALDVVRADVVRVDAGPPADLEGFLDYQMRVGGIRGLAASILVHGHVARTVTRGMANETAPVDEHTLFVAASVSKTFVGALALELVEAGRLDLDAPLDGILGYTVRNPRFPDTPITTRMLLTHTSGLTDDFGTLLTYTVEGMTDPTMTLDEMARTYLAVPAHYTARPGTAFSYCNAGFGVLGRVVELASGMDLRALSRARLFAPLALDGAGWWYADVDASRLSVEYVWDRPTDMYIPQPQRNYAHYPATSLRISIDGLSRWLLGHIGDGALEGTRFLSTESIAAERTAQFPSVRAGQDIVWYYSSHGGRRWLEHSGSSFGASNQMLYDPPSGRGIIVLTNSDAYIRSRLGQNEGSNAIEAIIQRLDAEANAL